MPTLTTETLHTCSTVQNITISAAEADLLVSLLRPRTRLLTDLLEVQVFSCPPGCDDWADTAEALDVATEALLKVRTVQSQYEQEAA